MTTERNSYPTIINNAITPAFKELKALQHLKEHNQNNQNDEKIVIVTKRFKHLKKQARQALDQIERQLPISLSLRERILIQIVKRM